MLYSTLGKEIANQDIASKLSQESEDLRTYQNCHSSSRLRAFLRLSRLSSDDTIKEHLNEVSKKDCNLYFKEKILPHWKVRAELIDYCFGEAATLRKNTEKKEETLLTNVDLRIDPYATKDAKEKLESAFAECLEIENWVNNERKIETIIRAHSADVLNQKCYYYNWLQAFQEFVKKV